jgi:hypothetical protein
MSIKIGRNKSNILNVKLFKNFPSFDSYVALLMSNFGSYFQVPVVSRSILDRLELFKYI